MMQGMGMPQNGMGMGGMDPRMSMFGMGMMGMPMMGMPMMGMGGMGGQMSPMMTGGAMSTFDARQSPNGSQHGELPPQQPLQPPTALGRENGRARSSSPSPLRNNVSGEQREG
jgi:CCR4-NOT transcriptional complex subunit CAF120